MLRPIPCLWNLKLPRDGGTHRTLGSVRCDMAQAASCVLATALVSASGTQAYSSVSQQHLH